MICNIPILFNTTQDIKTGEATALPIQHHFLALTLILTYYWPGLLCHCAQCLLTKVICVGVSWVWFVRLNADCQVLTRRGFQVPNYMTRQLCVWVVLYSLLSFILGEVGGRGGKW